MLEQQNIIGLDQLFMGIDEAVATGWLEDFIFSLLERMSISIENRDVLSYTKAVSMLPINLQMMFSNAS